MMKHELKISSMKEQCTEAEWEARVDLAACYRLVAHYGMSDMIANHISLRVPGESGTFLINAYGLLYEEITASSLLKIDHHGNILSKPDFGPHLSYGVNKAGFVIHSAIHEKRPEVDCVIHTHTWAGMAVSSLACGLLPLNQTSMRFARIGYHDYEGVVLDLSGTGIAMPRPGPERSPDPAQPWFADGRPHDRRGLQLDAPPGSILPRATGRDGLPMRR